MKQWVEMTRTASLGYEEERDRQARMSADMKVSAPVYVRLPPRWWSRFSDGVPFTSKSVTLVQK